MRKYNEGYALALVLVVMVVLCLVAVTVLSFSLRNLKTQQVFVERMADKYAAEGAIEAVKAQLDCLEVTHEGNSAEEIHGAVQQKITDICKAEYNGIKVEPTFITWPTTEKPSDKDVCAYTVMLRAINETSQITCQLKLTGEIKIDDKENGLEKDVFSFNDTQAVYESYEISTVASTEGGASQ